MHLCYTQSCENRFERHAATDDYGESMQPNPYKNRSIFAFLLFSAWLISFPYEGKVLYALLDRAGAAGEVWVISAIAAHLLGLLTCMTLVRSMKGARRMLLLADGICLIGTLLCFSPSAALLKSVLLVISFFAGFFMSAWGWFFRAYTPSGSRMDTAAKALAASSAIMIAVNLCVGYLPFWVSLGLCSLLLVGVLLFVAKTDPITIPCPPTSATHSEPISYYKPFFTLCLFIFVITINSGLMFQVVSPAFGNLGLVSDLYWAVPYIAAILLIRRYAKKVNQAYVLYLAIAMIGFSFIAFAALGRSIWNYLFVNTLLLGACGVYDLFWWSMLGELLDFDKNPARLLGLGLGANVAGVLAGKLIGMFPAFSSSEIAPALIGLTVVCLALVLLPPLHRQLSRTLQNNTFLVSLATLPPQQQKAAFSRVGNIAGLSERENEIAVLLIKGYPYKLIATRLYISESTVKTHVQSIYNKLCIHNRTELIERFSSDEAQDGSQPG